MATQTGRDSDKFMLRLPDGMRERIKAAAERNSRSMNAEIVHTLEISYPVKSDTDEYQGIFDIDSAFETPIQRKMAKDIINALFKHTKKND